MKKLFLGALIISCAAFVNAQGYNRVALSYEHPSLNFNKEASFWDDKSETVGLNGFGLNLWGIKRSDLFIAHANDIKCFVIQ